MKDKNQNKLYDLPAGHKKLSTRRDFLSHTAGAFAATAFAPTVWSMLMSQAQAALGGETIPFLVFDLAGGAALPGSFLVGAEKAGQIDLLPSYDRLGWDPTKSTINTQFGLPMNGTSSRIFSQINTIAQATTRANLRMGSFCMRSQDDTSSNPLSAVQLVNKACDPAKYLNRIIGTGSSISGGRSKCVDEDAARKSLNITSLNDFIDSVGYGRTFAGLPPEVGIEVSSGVLNLSKDQIKDLQRFSNGKKFADLANPSYEALAMQGNASAFDPRLDTAAAAVYGINANTDAKNAAVVNATIVMNALKGNSSCGVITIGGCDYHTNNSTEGDRVDTLIGTEIGRAVELAARLKKKLFFQILTDGGCGATAGTRNWSSDDGTKSMTIVGYYNPDAAPTQRRVQVGQFTSGQGADLKTLLGNLPNEAAHAVFANYLSVSGRIGEFSKYVPASIINSGNLDSVLIF